MYYRIWSIAAVMASVILVAGSAHAVIIDVAPVSVVAVPPIADGTTELVISAGGKRTISGLGEDSVHRNAIVGSNLSDFGELAVTDQATLRVTGQLLSGGDFSGTGKGRVTISGGAKVTANGPIAFPGIQIAPGANTAVGAVTVTGTGSEIIVEGSQGFINVGRLGDGELNILNDADVSITGTTSVTTGDFPGANMQIGRSTGATGRVRVSGAGSTLTMTSPNTGLSEIRVGRSPDTVGSLTIDGGGTVQIVGDADGRVVVGRDPGSNGSLLVNGANSMLDVGMTGRLLLGKDFDSATGTVLGDGGVASATVANGGTIRAGTVLLGADATLGGNGTIIGNVINDGGTVAPGLSTGKLTFQGDVMMDGLVVMEANSFADLDQIMVDGNLTFGSNAILEIILGFDPMGTPLTDLFQVMNGIITTDPGFQVIAAVTDTSGLPLGTQVMADIGGTMFTAAATRVSTTVPEPTTLALFAVGLAGLGFMRRRRFNA